MYILILIIYIINNNKNKAKKIIRNFHLTLDVFKYIFKLLKYVYCVPTCIIIISVGKNEKRL